MYSTMTTAAPDAWARSRVARSARPDDASQHLAARPGREPAFVGVHGQHHRVRGALPGQVTGPGLLRRLLLQRRTAPGLQACPEPFDEGVEADVWPAQGDFLRPAGARPTPG